MSDDNTSGRTRLVDRTEAGGLATTPRLALAKCLPSQGRFDDADHLLSPTLVAARDEWNFLEERLALDLLAQYDIGPVATSRRLVSGLGWA